MKTFIRRVASGLLAATVAAGCASTEIASTTSDRIVPEVTVSIQGIVGTNGVDSVSALCCRSLHLKIR